MRGSEIRADAVRSSEIQDESVHLADIAPDTRTALEARVRVATAENEAVPTCTLALTDCPNPILLINTRYDPNTGYANAVRAERLLGNAVLLTQEGYGHLSFRNRTACVDQAAVAYLTEPITPPAGTVCQSDQQPFDPDFSLGGAKTTSTAREGL